jgi:hypothetical protein
MKNTQSLLSLARDLMAQAEEAGALLTVEGAIDMAREIRGQVKYLTGKRYLLSRAPWRAHTRSVWA